VSIHKAEPRLRALLERAAGDEMVRAVLAISIPDGGVDHQVAEVHGLSRRELIDQYRQRTDRIWSQSIARLQLIGLRVQGNQTAPHFVVEGTVDQLISSLQLSEIAGASLDRVIGTVDSRPHQADPLHPQPGRAQVTRSIRNALLVCSRHDPQSGDVIDNDLAVMARHLDRAVPGGWTALSNRRFGDDGYEAAHDAVLAAIKQSFGRAREAGRTADRPYFPFQNGLDIVVRRNLFRQPWEEIARDYGISPRLARNLFEKIIKIIVELIT
jgi:hypothetical protein